MLKPNMKREKWLLLLPVVPFLLGLLFRYKELYFWLQTPEKFFFEGRPLFTSYDGYHYAKQALDFAIGKVQDIFSISLLGVLEGFLAKVFGVYPENVDLYLTPILASLVAFPVFYYWHKLGMPVVGFFGALTAALSPVYLIRTSIVRFDTDSLNLTLPMLAALTFLMSVKARPKLGVVFFLSSWIVLFLYEWWYKGHTYITASMIAAYLLFLVLEVLFNKRSRVVGSVYLGSTLLLLVALVIYKKINPIGLALYAVERAKAWTMGLEQADTGFLPNANKAVIELKKASLQGLADYTVGYEFTLLLSIVGLLLLLIVKFRYMIPMLPVLAMGVLSFFGAVRFSMYLAPFLGMGLGFLYYATLWLVSRYIEVYEVKKTFKFLKVLYFFVIMLITLPWITFIELRTLPKLTVQATKGYVELGKNSPPDAYILDWWDYGFAINYLSDRNVFHASSFEDLKSLFIAKAYLSSNQEEAFNIINAVSTGVVWDVMQEPADAKKVEKEIRQGRRLKEFPFPVYWSFNIDLSFKFGWVSYFGSWDFEAKEGSKHPVVSVYGCKTMARNVFRCDKGIFDFNRGVYIRNEVERIPIKAVLMKDDKSGKTSVLPYRRLSGIYVIVVKKGEKLARYIMDEVAFRSAFVQMYILRNYDKRYFELVYDDFPFFVAYRVKSLKEVMAEQK